jgi:hypothetical protein
VDEMGVIMAHMREIRNVYKTSVSICEAKRLLGRYRHRWRRILKVQSVRVWTGLDRLKVGSSDALL